jgi:hypothetical protein
VIHPCSVLYDDEKYGLSLIGIAATTTNVILTYLRYDHVGGFDQFPNTRFHLQDREMAFATGRNMTTREQSHSFTPRHIASQAPSPRTVMVSSASTSASLSSESSTIRFEMSGP